MSKVIKVGSDFSGVGAFDYAIQRVAKVKGFDVETVYACDWDKYARISYVAAHGEPKYYPKDVYERAIPEEPLDFYMTSPPCQAFSLAGKRLGKDDAKGRGILFFNSLEFIEKNKPRFFIFENVKGLLSDDNGRTFQEWVNLLGGKSVNGVPVLFPYEGAVDYHLYWQVLNTKEHGVPQNRERVFIIGIRDNQDNDFRFPIKEHLTKRLKDILEEEVIEKFYLSDAAINKCLKSSANSDMLEKDIPEESRCIVGTWRTHEDGKGFRQTEDNNCPTIPARAREDGSGQPVVMQINPSTESGGVQPFQQNRVYDTDGISPALCSNLGGERNHNILCSDEFTTQYSGISVHPNSKKMEFDGFKDIPCPTLLATDYKAPKCIQFNDFRVRRLTPLECFRLQDFPDEHTAKCRAAGVSDSQLYKQAGNSITVRVLEKILMNLPL